MVASTVSNLNTYAQGAAAGLFPTADQASGSAPGESNEKHVVVAIGIIAAAVILAGVVNARISIGRRET